jgi:hypothetical protein
MTLLDLQIERKIKKDLLHPFVFIY